MYAVIAIVISVVALAISVGTICLLCWILKSMAAALKDDEPPPASKSWNGEDPWPGDAMIGAWKDNKAGTPETLIGMPTGRIGIIDSAGVLRTERATYDPLASQFTPESNDSPDSIATVQAMADVIDLHKRIPGEQ